jgi:hypothetical protein
MYQFSQKLLHRYDIDVHYAVQVDDSSISNISPYPAIIFYISVSLRKKKKRKASSFATTTTTTTTKTTAIILIIIILLRTVVNGIY